MSARYLVLSIACLECNNGDAAPELVVATDDRGQALEAATKPGYSSEYDMFVVDTRDGSFLTPNTYTAGP